MAAQASDAVVMDQEQHPDQSGSLAQLFANADSAIERKRTENIFKQLDERSLTADEEKIIQQRVELQRKLLEEYEKREQKRKVAELQDMWPDLSEAAAGRALELCNGKEEEAVLRLTEDSTFRRRVMQETGTYTPTGTTIVVAPKAGGGARNTRGTSSARSTTTRIKSPSQMGGRVFVGRFRSKLGPYQMMDPAHQAAMPAQPNSNGAPPLQLQRKRGRPSKADIAAAAAAMRSVGSAAGAGPSSSAAAAAAAGGSGAQPADVAAALAAAAALSAVAPTVAEVAAARDAAAAAGGGGADAAERSSKRQRSTSPSSSTEGFHEDEDSDEDDGASEPEAGEAAAAGNVIDTDTGAPPHQARRQQQDQQQQVVHADRVIGMMARQVARLEPLVAAGRLLEFESRRPGSSPAVLEQLAAEYGTKVSVPIATAWEVLLEEQKLNATLGLQQTPAATTTSSGGGAAAAAAGSSKGAQREERGPASLTTLNASGDVSSPLRRSSRRSLPQQQQQPSPRGRWEPRTTPQQQQQQQQQQEEKEVEDKQRQQDGQQTAAAAAEAPSCSDASTISEAGAADDGQPGVTGGATGTTPTSTRRRPQASAALPAAGEPEAAVADEAAAAVGSSGRGRRAAAAGAAAAISAAAAAASDRGSGGGGGRGGGGRGRGRGGKSRGGYGGGFGRGGGASRAISETGHTCRGRVRQKSHKTTELVEVGELVVAKDWYNAGYIFPAGFKTRLLFRSSVDTDALCLHECEIVNEGGKFWPAPTFVVTARDREDEPVVGKSCTGCWSQILKRINATIAQRIAAGENLPPPPRTAIAGPEYFGLNDLSTIAAVEALDPDHLCTTYWEGKQQREAASAGLPIVVQPLARPSGGNNSNNAAAAAAAGGGGGGGGGGSRGTGRKRGRPRASDADADDEGDDDDDEGGYKGSAWSAISRRERYLKRCTEAGDELPVDDDHNLLPGVLDPVTLEPVVNPAISPAGHVMGLATWKAVLSETGRCPFTKAPLRVDMLTVLTVNNIEKHRDRIVAMS